MCRARVPRRTRMPSPSWADAGCWRRITLAFALFPFTWVSTAQFSAGHVAGHEQGPACHLRTGVVHASAHRRSLLQPAAPDASAAVGGSWWRGLEDVHQYLLMLEGKVDQATREAYSAALGGEGQLAEYLPHNSFLLVATPEGARRAAAVQGTAAVAPYQPHLRIDPSLQHNLEEQRRRMSQQSSQHSFLLPSTSSTSLSLSAPEASADALVSAVGLWQGSSSGGGVASGGVNASSEAAVDSTRLEGSPVAGGQGPPQRLSLRATLPRVQGLDMGVVENAARKALAAAEGCRADGGGGSGGGGSSGGGSSSGGGEGVLCELHHVGGNRLVVEAASAGRVAEAAAAALASLPFVHWVEGHGPLHTRNWEAAAVLQSGAEASSPELLPKTYDPYAGVFPLWDAGLTGNGEVLGMADAGLDLGSCYFYDPNNGNEPSPDHRKVVSYRKVGDGEDKTGHGTHTAGTLVGDTDQEEWKMFDGMAPGAKLAFTDLGYTESGMELLRVPPDGIPGILQFDYEQGSRVHSDSWGGQGYSYDDDCAAVDTFSWDHPDFVSVIAAGNDGGLNGMASTIGSPASAKNAISVGAALSADSFSPVVQGAVYGAFLLSMRDVERIRILVGTNGGAADKGRGAVSAAQQFDALLNSTYELAFADPADGCVAKDATLGIRNGITANNASSVDPSGSAKPFEGKVVFLLQYDPNSAAYDTYDDGGGGEGEAEGSAAAAASSAGNGTEGLAEEGIQGRRRRLGQEVQVRAHNATASSGNSGGDGGGSECLLFDRVAAAAAAGAVAVLIAPYDDSGMGFPSMANIEDPLRPLLIPTGGVPRSTYDQALRVAEMGEVVSLALRGLEPNPNSTVQDVASFSGFGPTDDGRVKPDVLAVGDQLESAYLSAKAGTCQTSSSSGTSMAAPVVAGGLALLRQYFREGWYPSGVPQAADERPEGPSGALLKAVLLNGAQEMRGLTEAGLPLEATPSFRQGWGLARLDSSVPLGDAPRFSLWVQDDANADVGTNETREYCVTLPDGTGDGAGNATSGNLGIRRALQEGGVAGMGGMPSPIPHPTQVGGEGETPTADAMGEEGGKAGVAGEAGGSSEEFPPVLGVPLRATLAWYDPAASPSAAVTLINDLDLELLVPPGTLSASRGAAPIPDRLNTVERAEVLYPVGGGRYLVRVTGHNVPQPREGQSGVPYALVVTAPPGAEVCACGVDQGCDCALCPSMQGDWTEQHTADVLQLRWNE